MTEIPAYTVSHSRWYRPRVSTYWWLWRRTYLKFILRELSSVGVAYFVALLLLLVRALSHGPEAYLAFQQWLKTPHMIVLNSVSLLCVLFHSITWFNLAPRAMVVRVHGHRVPDLLIAGANYAAWLVVSVAVAWLVLRG